MRGRTSVHEDFWALKDVTFDVPVGSTFGLIGSIGSGKSTLLKCLANIYYPNKGSITHFGRIAAMLEVGSGFHTELSGRENIFLNGSILGMSKKEITNKFDTIVDFSGVEEFIDQPVKNYSSGMYVRLGFAIAINVNPDILVVDEVLAVGDAEFQEKCFQKFRDLKTEGKTVILVSHSMDTVRSMCDHAAWLSHGELKAVGEARPTIQAYLNSLARDTE
jgi:ABC-2 type transport system ATP-binding protein